MLELVDASTEAVVRSYYAVVADLSRTEDDLAAILHPDATLVEHPNPVVPRGARRGIEEALSGFRAGRALLSEQSFEIQELIATGSGQPSAHAGTARSAATPGRSAPGPG